MGKLIISSQENPERFFSRISDSDLYLCFCRNNWVELNENDRLLLLGEVVNRENMKYGGNYSVDISFKDMKSNIAGYQTGNHIFLNKEMFVNDRMKEVYGDKSIEFELNDSNWQALETVLHENRHVFQDKVAEGVVKCDEASKNIFASNCFTVSSVDGKRASQYMLGENNYALYYLNPTEIDAYKTSQERTQQIICALSRQGMKDVSADKYMSTLQITGYKTKLEEFKKEFNNVNVDKEVEQVLKNTYFNMNVPVDKTIESAVKQEMIWSQEVIDNQNRMEIHSTANKEYSENGFDFMIDESGTMTAEEQVPAQQGGSHDAYMINDTITTTDGKTQSARLSLRNMSSEMQKAQKQEVNEMNIDNEFDNTVPFRESISKEQYNSSMEEESRLPSVKDGFDMSNTPEMSFNEDYINEANATYEGKDISTDNDSADVGNDSGQSAGADMGTDGGCGIEI